MAATPQIETSPLAKSSRDELSNADRIGLVVGGQFISAIIGLAQGILFVRLLNKSSYGTLSFVLLLYGTGRELGTLTELVARLTFGMPGCAKRRLSWCPWGFFCSSRRNT